MLSFLIPTYNYNCTTLVLTLYRQSCDLKSKMKGSFDFEIIVADDASPQEEYVTCYEQLSDYQECRFIALAENYGRARIRNFLAHEARFDHLVFIDCDAEICTPDFVASYWQARTLGQVVCGSLRNPKSCPAGGELRYRYEKSAECQRTVAFRNAHPYTYFTTFNVMFQRAIFQKIGFDERCTEYGYEDALMGVMLEQNGYQVAHIDNPLVHNGIDPSAVYLSKIETSLGVLYKLGEPLHSASALVLLKRKLEAAGLKWVVSLGFSMCRKLLRKHLTGKHPSMSVLKFYKLGYYLEIEQHARGKRTAP